MNNYNIVWDANDCTHTTQEVELSLDYTDAIKILEAMKPILIGIGINKTMYRWLKKNAGELHDVTSWSISPWGMVPVFVKNHQRGYKLFYNKDELREYVNKLEQTC